MPKETSGGKAKKAAAKKAVRPRAGTEGSQCEYVECPVARIFGLCDEAGSDLKSLNVNDFLAHMASARKEFLLGMRSILEEAIRLEDERIERRQAASKKKESKGRPRRISIE